VLPEEKAKQMENDLNLFQPQSWFTRAGSRAMMASLPRRRSAWNWSPAVKPDLAGCLTPIMCHYECVITNKLHAHKTTLM